MVQYLWRSPHSFFGESNMASRSIQELGEELRRLMDEQIATLKKERFGGLSASGIRKQEELLTRIREVSADYVAALKRDDP